VMVLDELQFMDHYHGSTGLAVFERTGIGSTCNCVSSFQRATKKDQVYLQHAQ
jgi:hypothetical protein